MSIHRRAGRAIRCLAVLASMSLACDTAPPAPPAAPALPDSITLDGIRALVETVGPANLFERVSKPDEWLTDLFGVQALQAIPLDRIESDLVPAHATAVGRDAHSVTVDFTDGPRVRFMSNTTLLLGGNVVDMPYAHVLIADSAAYPRETVEFRARLIEAGLADRYLVSNPHFDDEQLVEARMREGAAIEAVTPSTDPGAFAAAAHAIRIIGETHGGTEAYDRALELLDAPDVDWIAIEMLSTDRQPAATRFVEAGDDTPDHEAARRTLLDYYDANWNTRGHEITADPAQNPYFLLIERARSLGKPVVAMDASPEYIMFRFGEFPLGATVRDYVWANSIPASGRGIVYGGSAHFLQSRRPNMLTFLRDRFPSIVIVTAER